MRNLSIAITLLFGLSVISCSDSGTGTTQETESEPKNYTVTISASPNDGGSISPADENTYEEGEEIELEASANDEYDFTGWAGDIESSDNPHTLTVNQDYDITANFEEKTYELTVNKEGDGEVSEEVIQQKSTEYEHGAVVELKATPETGYEFTEWTGDLNSPDNPKTIVVDEPKTVTAHFNVKNDKAALKINVDWDNIGQSQSKQFTNTNNTDITHFGARLVYPEENAVFTQSVEKVTADSMGIITMEVPPSDSARLLVTGVQYENNDNQLIKMGVLEDLSIEQGKSYEWNVEDITWTDPHWKPADSLATDYENGTFTVDKNKEKFEFYFLVRDPYYPKADPDLSNYLIRLNGTGGNFGYENGYRIMRQVVENPDIGNANEEYYDNFYPYLKSEMFQLPSEGPRYVVYKKGSFTVSWE